MIGAENLNQVQISVKNRRHNVVCCLWPQYSMVQRSLLHLWFCNI